MFAVVLVVAACGGGDEDLSGFTNVTELRGRTIGVASFDDTSTLELRYVLQEAHGLQAGLEGASVTLIETPLQELLMQLSDGEVHAVLLPPGRPDIGEEYRVLSRITQEMRELTGVPVAGSVLLTYADVADQKLRGLTDLNRMLNESMTYFDANRDDVIRTVAVDQEVDEGLIRAWWDALDLLFGDISTEVQDQIVGLWRAAMALGDIEDVPVIESLILAGLGEVPGIEVGDDVEEPDTGDRTAISLAVLDDPSRRAALYAVEQGIVGSDIVDLNITYLAPSEMADAATARQFDVVEATPLAVPLGIERDLQFVIVSGGLQDVDGTLLIVLNR